MCRAAISAETLAGVCSSCPLYHMTSGCRVDLIACPQCGYHSLPAEHDLARSGPAVPRADAGAGADVALCSGAVPLSEMPSGSRARLLGFRDVDDNYLGRLTAYGMLPGVNVEVLQRFPAIILGVYQAELALETELAAGIWVLPA
jgi:Fe2+ transport system protein FeoA